MERITLKDVWENNFKGLLSYNTFRKYVSENIDFFKDVMIVKQNEKRKTIRILDKDVFINKFKELY